jgi:hypothetical protein
MHPDGRRLVFLGDLTDRGPDSPAVVELVRDLMLRGRAQCVLGNHELNVLRRQHRPDTAWLFDTDTPYNHHGIPVPQVRATLAQKRAFLRFFQDLPVALERADLRIVHACWDDDAIDLLRSHVDVMEVYEQHHQRILLELRHAGPHDEVGVALAHQNDNPVRLLTSGPEHRAEPALVVNGKPRHQLRVPWWRNYAGPFCVFGHYWRTLLPGEGEELHLFHHQPREAVLGGGYAMCIDFSAGKRFRERLQPGFDGSFATHLAALRWPERVLAFDNEDSPVPLAEARRSA